MKKVIVLAMVIALSVSSVMAGDDESYYKDFVKFLEVSGAVANQKVMLQNMTEQFKKMPNANQNALEDMEKIMNKEIAELNKQLFPIYKKYLTHDDLKEIIKFYESPIGKKMVKSQPMITKEAFQIGVKWGQGVAKRVLEKMQNKENENITK